MDNDTSCNIAVSITYSRPKKKHVSRIKFPTKCHKKKKRSRKYVLTLIFGYDLVLDHGVKITQEFVMSNEQMCFATKVVEHASLDGFGVSMSLLGCEWSRATSLRNGLLPQQCLATQKAIRIGRKHSESITYEFNSDIACSDKSDLLRPLFQVEETIRSYA